MRNSRTGFVIFATLLLAFCFIAINAQSGRRAPKTAPTPTPEESPEPKQSPKKQSVDKPEVALILGIDGDSFTNVPLYYYDAVLQSCANRINEASTVALDVSEKQMNRGEAIKIAKSQKEGYVAALRLRSDAIDAGSTSNQNIDLYVEYTVFAPGTAKVVSSGHAYQRVGKTGSILSKIPTARTSGVYTEELLKQAGRDAADKILDALHVTRQKVVS